MVKTTSSVVAAVTLLAISRNVVAEEDETFRWGGYVSYSYSRVDDPDGSVAWSSGFTRVGGVVNFKFNRKSLVESSIYYNDDTYAASSGNIGQTVKGFGFNASYFRNFSWTRNFQPWFGLGLALNNFEYTKRFSQDSDGFLDEQFIDRSDQETSVLVSGKYIYELDKTFDVYANLQFEIPVDTGVEGVFINIGLIF